MPYKSTMYLRKDGLGNTAWCLEMVEAVILLYLGWYEEVLLRLELESVGSLTCSSGCCKHQYKIQ